MAESYADLLKAHELDLTNAYVFRNFGVYHLALGEKSKAYHYFQKAKELKPNTYGIDGLLREAVVL